MKGVLLTSTALICVSLCSANAMAACSNTTPANNETVTCTGTSTTEVNGIGKTGVTVNVTDGAQLNVASGAAIATGAQGTVTLFGNATVKNALALDGYGVYFKGDNGHLTLNGSSSILTYGEDDHAVLDRFQGAFVVLNDQSHIQTVGNDADGINIGGNNATVTLNGDSIIQATGNDSNGLTVVGDNAVITLNDHSAIDVTGHNDEGVGLSDNNNLIFSLNGTASIRALGHSSEGINLSSGDNDTIIIGRAASIASDSEGIVAVDVRHLTIINHGTITSATADGITINNGASANNTVFNDGTIIGGDGTSIQLSAGEDTLILATGSHLVGSVYGYGGTDTLILNGTGSEDDRFFQISNLIMNGQDWSLSGASGFTNIDIQHGRLAVNGAITATAGTTVEAAGILGGSGTLTGNVNSTGTIAPGNSVGTLTINGTVTQTGGKFAAEFDQHGVDRLNVIGHTATLSAAPGSGGPVLTVTPIGGAAGAGGIVLHADNGITGSFAKAQFLGNGAATLVQTANDISLTTIDGTSVEGTDFAAAQAGLDFIDTVDEETVAGFQSCGEDQCSRDRDRKHLWAKAFGRFGNEQESDGNRPFDYRIAGTAMGGDMQVANGLRLGASLGYSNTDETLTHDAATGDIDTTQAAFYGRYEIGRFFVTGQVNGGWQHIDQSRNLAGNDSADASTNGWLLGTSLQAGAHLAFPNNWHLTPSIGASYQHQWVDGYKEHGGGAEDVSIDDHHSGALRLRAQLLLEQDYQLTDLPITPHLKVGALEQLALGGHANGKFAIDGSDFSLALNDRDRVAGLFGAGMQFSFQNGLATYVDYDGSFATEGVVHAVTGGLRYDW